ncbi:unnamed protein product [Camellia sinensis]
MDKRPPRPQNVQHFFEDTNGSLEDNVVGNDLHGVSSEKQEKRTRNKDRPDHGVWTPLRRSDGSHASDESLSSSASQSTQLQPDSAEGGHGEVKFDLSNARSGEFKTVGTGRSGYHSLDNVWLSIISEGKLLKKGGSSGYGSHEVNKCGFRSQVLVLNVVLTVGMSYAVSVLLFIAPRYIGFLCNWQSGLRESTKLGAAFNSAE